KWFGDKTGQGFYKKIKGENGKSEILTLDLNTLQYHPKKKSKFPTIDLAKPIDDLKQRLKVLYNGQDKAGEFYRKFHHLLFAYVSHRLPEIADELYKIDDGLKAGFGWEIGAFETWQALGIKQVLDNMDAEDINVADWVKDMIKSGHEHFYLIENGQKKFFDLATKSYKNIPGTEAFLLLENLSDHIIWKNSACQLLDRKSTRLNSSHVKI